MYLAHLNLILDTLINYNKRPRIGANMRLSGDVLVSKFFKCIFRSIIFGEQVNRNKGNWKMFLSYRNILLRRQGIRRHIPFP